MIEDYSQCVKQTVSCHITAGIPNASLEWVIVSDGFSIFQNFSPCHLFVVRASHVEDRDIFWSKRQTEILLISLQCNNKAFGRLRAHSLACQIK